MAALSARAVRVFSIQRRGSELPSASVCCRKRCMACLPERVRDPGSSNSTYTSVASILTFLTPDASWRRKDYPGLAVAKLLQCVLRPSL